MALVIKNTFLDVEKGRITIRRSSSEPCLLKYQSADFQDGAFASDASTADTPTAALDELSSNASPEVEIEPDALEGFTPTSTLETGIHILPLQTSGTTHQSVCTTLVTGQTSPAKRYSKCDGPKLLSSPSSQKGHKRVPQRKYGIATLRKKKGTFLGLDVDSSNGITLSIDGIVPGGLADLWNQANPRHQIPVGGQIVEVNGFSGSSAKLIALCLPEFAVLRVRFTYPKLDRPVQAEQLQAEPAMGPNDSSSLTRTSLNVQAPLFIPQGIVDDCAPCFYYAALSEFDDMLSHWQNLMTCNPNVLGIQRDDHTRDNFASSTQLSLQVDAALGSLHKREVLSLAQRLLLAASATSQRVYVLGYAASPFESMHKDSKGHFEEEGFHAALSVVPDDQINTVCWDTYQKGFCPRPATCCWSHPKECNSMEIRVVLESVKKDVAQCY